VFTLGAQSHGVFSIQNKSQFCGNKIREQFDKTIGIELKSTMRTNWEHVENKTPQPIKSDKKMPVYIYIYIYNYFNF
jgi:hypothetical protein